MNRLETNMRISALAILMVALASTALAQSPGEYSLDQGFIKFNAPPSWPVSTQWPLSQ